jgi:cation diffusion facilitator family transporter
MIASIVSSITRIAAVSIVVGVIVLALKAVAWWLTGSVALYSDAAESVVNIATAIAALIAIRYSALPPDANHPYGHQKAEYFSVVLEGVLVIIAAIVIAREAWVTFLNPRAIEQPALGLAINVVASLVNGAWCWVLLREGRRRRSPALVADGKHLLTDVITSVGVVVGVILTVATGKLILDPLLAAAVALNILWQGWRLVRVSIGGLMDEALPADTLTRIRTIIKANADGALEAHDLRTRAAGRMTFIEFHLVVPGTMPVSESHDICDRIERALRAEVSDATITIHVEPEAKAKHSGVVVL